MALRTVSTIGKKDSGEKSKKWFAIAVGVIMLMSVAGFVLSFNPSTQQTSFRYGGLLFKQDQQQGFFTTEANSRQIDFFYRPEDVLEIEVPAGAVEKLTGSRVVYVTYGWNSTLAESMALLQFDTANILDAKHGVFVQPAFTTPNPAINISIITCNDATSFIPVLLLQEANNTAIGLDSGNQDCIVLNASSETGFWKAADRLKYAIISAGAAGANGGQ